MKIEQYILYLFINSGLFLFSFFLCNLALWINDIIKPFVIGLQGSRLMNFLCMPNFIILTGHDISRSDLYIFINLSYASFASLVENTDE